MNFRNFNLPCTRATEVNYRLLKILGEPKLRPKEGGGSEDEAAAEIGS